MFAPLARTALGRPLRSAALQGAARGGRAGAAALSLSRAEATSVAGRLPEERLVVLTILDGWGYRETAADNAVVRPRAAPRAWLYAAAAQKTSYRARPRQD